MTDVVAISLAQSGLILVLTLVGPMLGVSLVVGVVIGLFQALTSIQEMTLTFVPKLVAIGVVLLLSLPMIGHAMSAFMANISALIVSG